MTTVVDAAAASLWLDPQTDDNVGMLTKGFERVFGKSGAREAARAALRCDEHAYAGYAKWELNDRWDAAGGPEGPARSARGARFFTRLAKQKNLPAPFTASATFNSYLAAREAFLRTSVRTVQKLRLLHERGQNQLVTYYVTKARTQLDEFTSSLRSGQTAARAMWRRTRDPKAKSPNELILDRDTVRLREWKRWLAAVAKKPAHALTASPVHGRWQLTFFVHNFAPALQKILVEQQSADGTWTTLAERFTIEFSAKAARPRAKIRREFSVSIEDPSRPLRIALRGVGEIAVSNVVLNDGLNTLQPAHCPARERRRMGSPAPTHGFPDLSLGQNREALELDFHSSGPPLVRVSP
jgi:hypothetical protein